MGAFERIFTALAGQGPRPERIIIDATHLKARRTAASLLKKEMFPSLVGRTGGGLNSRLHTVCDGEGRPSSCCSAKEMSDRKGICLLLDALSAASHPIGDRGYDSTWLRRALAARGIVPWIPSSRSRKRPYPYLYRQRQKVENLFAKLKDWRRIATHYDRCAHTVFSAVCIDATRAFRL